MKRKTNPAKYWRQGMYLGVLDNAIDALLVPGKKSKWKTYGEFESEFRDKTSKTHKTFLTCFDILEGFHPKERPILWRMLWTQSLIYKKILEIQSGNVGPGQRVALGHVSPKIPQGSLDWRKNPGDATNDEVFVVPERVAQEYLHARLPEVFGALPAS